LCRALSLTGGELASETEESSGVRFLGRMDITD
jgi:hypothetical protein